MMNPVSLGDLLVERYSKIWPDVEMLDGALCINGFFVAWIDGTTLTQGKITSDPWNQDFDATDPEFFTKFDVFVEGLMEACSSKKI